MQTNNNFQETVIESLFIAIVMTIIVVAFVWVDRQEKALGISGKSSESILMSSNDNDR